DRVRVAIVCPYDLAEEGGVKRHAFNLARALRRCGDDVTLVGASSRAETQPGVVGFGGIINIPNNGSDNRLAFLTPPWRIRRFFREGGFDVVHVMEPQAPLLSGWSVLSAKESARV